MSALEAVDASSIEAGDADDVLRAVVGALVADEGGCDWAGILFVENGELVLGPEAGDAAAPRRASSVPVVFRRRARRRARRRRLRATGVRSSASRS